MPERPDEPDPVGRVCALVPTWNGGGTVEETLHSLAAQDHPDLMIVVGDDASTDDTWERCLRFSSDPRFSFRRHDRRRGWVDNISDLFEAATGDFAFVAPQDDQFEPSYVRRMLAALDEHPDAVLAFSHTSMFGRTDPPELRTGERSAGGGGPVRRGLRWILMVDRDRAIPFRGVVRLPAAREAGRMIATSSVPFAADVRWLFRLNLIGRFLVVPEVLCHKRDYPAGIVHGGTEHRAAYTRRARMGESLLYARAIREARLTRRQQGALLAGVLVRTVLVALPGRARQPVVRVVARLVA